MYIYPTKLKNLSELQKNADLHKNIKDYCQATSKKNAIA